MSSARLTIFAGALGFAARASRVCGLNPHAGEGGLLGDRRKTHYRSRRSTRPRAYRQCDRPLPADTFFFRAYHGEFDAVVAMYHDQGLAPFKLIAFDNGVNVTLGLPFIRTSPDHGTAPDITGKGSPAPTA